MTKGLVRSLKNARQQDVPVVKKTFTVRDVEVTVDGASGVGFGSAVIGDFPEGNIKILSAVSYMQFTGPTSADLADDWEGDYGIGTTPAGDATITATDINVIDSTAIAAATAEASPRTRGVHSATNDDDVLDNTDGSLELNLSLLIDDVDIGADGIVVTANGELHLAYIVLGDD